MAFKEYNLVYMSSAAVTFGPTELADLLNHSRKFNLERSVTGLLLFADGSFMQLLEGPKEEVTALMDRIKKDERHRGVVVLEEGYVAQRQFAHWSMAFVNLASPEIRALPGYNTFLERPLRENDFTTRVARSVELLNYFKAIMTASTSTMLNMTESIESPKPPAADKK